MFIPGSPNAPLLRSNNNEESFQSSSHRHSFREAIRVFQRASNRPGLMMREPSDQLNDRQMNWAYSKPVVIIDVLWNFMYVFAAILVLVMSTSEVPEMPLRVWVVGYSLLCLLHIVCVLLEYRRRRRYGQSSVFGSSTNESSSGSSGYVTLAELTPERTSNLTKYMDSTNTMLSFFWWIIGFYWKGADKEDIEQLSKYVFRCNGSTENCTGEIQGTLAGFITLSGRDSPTDERSLSIDDAECSICLSTYEDGDELRELPCGHLFHCTCIDKWLYISATCPLCKRSIVEPSRCCEDA